MPDEKRKDDEEIQDILSDLDSILSEAPASAAAPAAKPPPAAPPPPAPLPPVTKAAEPPKPAPAMKIELTAPAAPKAEPPKPAAPPPPPPAPKIELSAPSIAPPPPPPAAAPKPVEPPKPAAAPAPAAAKPAAAPVPAAASGPGLKPAAALSEDAFPDKTPKSQIRRVAYIYLDKFEKERDVFAAFLMTTAQTVSKKPLFLRKVLFQPVGDQTDVTALSGRIMETKAVSVMGLVEGMSEAKLKDITDALGNAGLMFRVVPPAEVQKRAVAVDIIVDMMLLSPEE